MIDPVTGAALADSLAGLTAGMSGMSLADAYNQYMTDTYTDASGIEIGVGNYMDNKPAITGDTSNTVIDSTNPDPLGAFQDYETAGGVIDSTTGGFIYGSLVDTYNYSLLQNPNNEVQAVAPVAVPIDRAIVAISQALGVSMKLSEVNPVLADKFARSLLASGMVYNAAKGLVTAWWDGVHMLFPKEAVESIYDTMIQEEIGKETSTSEAFPGVSVPSSGSASYSSGEHALYANGATFIVDFDNQIVGCSSSPGSMTYQTWSYPGPAIHTNTAELSYHGVINGMDVYYGVVGATHDAIQFPDQCSGTRYTRPQLCYVALYGDHVGGYPEGTWESLANAYTPTNIPSGGGVAHKIDGGQGIDTIDVVPINMPLNPEDTTGSTADPISTPTNPEQEEELPAPPIPTPVPDTNISNPDVPLVDSSVINSTLVDELVEELANTLDPQPEQSSGIVPFPFMPGTPVDPDDPSQGSSYPSIVPASGSGLIHVYNPTPGEFVGFGNWLWVTYADATIDKIWNNPFDGIIGAHELYSTPQTDGRDNIRSGFLVCPVTSALVRQRYTEFDCGTVVIPEFYGNYFDYSPYSQAYIYLPFIGINEVSIDDIVGHAVNIRYRVDAYNGSCIAMIYVAKNGYRNLCYQFAGNCAVEVPLAGGSQAAIKAGMLQAEAYARATVQSAQIQKTASIGSGIVHGAAAGAGAGPLGGILGALAGGTAGYIQGAANYGAAKLQAGAMQEAARYANKSSVQHSGQFGLSHGAMGLKKPFIMIRNPIQVKVVNYNQDYGFPAHKRVIIGGCTGYLRVREVNVVSAHATNEEKRAIEEALKQGVYVTP